MKFGPVEKYQPQKYRLTDGFGKTRIPPKRSMVE